MTDLTVANPFTPEGAHQLKQTTASTDVAVQRELAEVQAAVLMARRFPRDPLQAMDAILRACTRPTLAKDALYQYARGGTDISGPSIRLAEAMAQTWGNLTFGIRELEQRSGESTVEAYCWDMETNVRQSRIFQVRHERHTRQGTYKLNDPRDIYEANANQGARRLRACILGIIPGDVREAAVTQCEQTLLAEADTSPEAIKKLLDAFAPLGVTQKQIETRIQRHVEAIRPAQIVQLRKIWASLNDGMSEVGDWFEAIALDEAPPQTGNAALREAIVPKAPAVPRQDEPTEEEIERQQNRIAAVLGPEEIAKLDAAEEPETIPVVKPQRLQPERSRSGWNWAGYVDELIAVAAQLDPAQIAALRAANASMINSLRISDKDQWSRIMQALANYERGDAANAAMEES